MAFNEILVGRINRWVQKLLVIKNTALRALNPDLQAVLPIYSGVEERYLQGWNRFAQDFAQGAVAAQFSIGEIRNPANSSVVIVIESCQFRNNSAATNSYAISIQTTNADQGTVSTTQTIRIDRRGNPVSVAPLSVGTSATQPVSNAPNRIVTLTVGASVEMFVTVDQQWNIQPGDAFFMFCTAANTQVNCSAQWRERVLESSELT